MCFPLLLAVYTALQIGKMQSSLKQSHQPLKTVLAIKLFSRQKVFLILSSFYFVSEIDEEVIKNKFKLHFCKWNYITVIESTINFYYQD